MKSLGYVYLPFSSPSNDWYGGSATRRWPLRGELGLPGRTQRQTSLALSWVVHHGLWDYDLPAAPNLIDVAVNGTPVKAVAQVSKQGFVYVFDRVTGRPIWPIEERPVPQSTTPARNHSALSRSR